MPKKSGKLKVLTKAIAKKFLKDEDSLDLSGFTAIEDEAAQLLSNHKGDLCLSGIASLSESVAESLSIHEGHLDLSGVDELSTQAAASLGKHQGTIDLSGLNSLCGVDASILRDINRISAKSLFENFTEEMEVVYRAAMDKSEDSVRDASFYVHDPECGKNSHESFFEFYDCLSTCRHFPLWMIYDDEKQFWVFFKGTQRQVTARLAAILGNSDSCELN